MHLNIYLNSLTVILVERDSFLPYAQGSAIQNHALVFQSSAHCLRKSQ